MSTTNDDIEITDEIRKGVSEVLIKQLNSNDIEISYEFGSKKGDNYVGIVYAATGKVKNNNNNEKLSEFKLIVKVSPQNLIRREQFRSRTCFIREIKMYDEVLPMFRAFQQSCGVIPEENGFHEYPPCYNVISSDLNESLIFRDLREDGFLMYDRLKEPTFDHVRLVMEALGKYHALSFALRDQNPEKLKQYCDLPEIFMDDMERFQTWLDHLMIQCIDALSDEKDAALLEKVKNRFDGKYNDEMNDAIGLKAAEPYAVICHGDCWNNNILYKNDKNGVPTEIRLLDFQVSRFASPVTDIVYYLFCCTSKKLRDQYYDDIINAYYRSVSEMISRLGSNPDELFPYDALQAQLKRFGKFGFLTSMMILNMITLPSEECIDMDEFAEAFESTSEEEKAKMFFKPNDIFKKRMRDVAIDMDRLGYI